MLAAGVGKYRKMNDDPVVFKPQKKTPQKRRSLLNSLTIRHLGERRITVRTGFLITAPMKTYHISMRNFSTDLVWACFYGKQENRKENVVTPVGIMPL